LLLLPAACSKEPGSSAPKDEIKKISDNNAVSQENRDAQAVPNDQQASSDAPQATDPAPSESIDKTFTDIGEAARDAGRDNEAREAFEDALLFNLGNLIALSSLGKYEFDDGNYAGAKAYFQQMITTNPDISEGWNNLAVATLQLDGDDGLGEAEQYFRQAVYLMPIGAFQMNLANVLLKMNRPEEAIPYLKAVSATGSEAAAANLKIAEEMVAKKSNQ